MFEFGVNKDMENKKTMMKRESDISSSIMSNTNY